MTTPVVADERTDGGARRPASRGRSPAGPDHKPRVQGKIAKLELAQQQQLLAWMAEGLTYKEIRKRALDLFWVSISPGSLSKYYSKHSREILYGAPAASNGAPGEPLHATLVLHIQIRPELVSISAA